MSSGKTTRRTFISRTGMIASGLTLGLDQLSSINILSGDHPAFNGSGSGELKKIAGIGDQLTGPEVPQDHYIIYPEPKMLNKSGGRLSLASLQLVDQAFAPNTSSLLKDKLMEQYGFTFSGNRNKKLIISLIDNKAIQKTLKKNIFTTILNDKKPDGYIIIITPKSVLLAGRNNRGIYYAVRAFLQIVSHSTMSGEPPCAECMEIADWPDQEMRGIFWRMDNHKDVKPDINMIKHYIYTAIAGTRYNTLVFMMRGAIRYKSHPELALGGAFTREEFMDIVAFARLHYLEPIPGMDTPGHADWIVEKHPEFSELNNRTICTRNPDALKLVWDVADEMIELCGGTGNVRYFHVGHDEIRWRMFTGPKYEKFRDECPRCKDTPYNQIFLEYLRLERDFFAKRGIRMIMWDDMVSEYHNGKQYNTSSILPDMPRDIILSPWSAIAYASIRDYLKLGFTVLKGATGYKVVSVNDSDVMGHMLAYFTREMWFTYSPVALSSHNYYNHLSTYIYGDNAWTNDLTLTPKDHSEFVKLKETVQVRSEKKRHDFLMKYGNSMNYCYNNKRCPAETSEYIKIDLNSGFNSYNKNCFGAGDLFDLSDFRTGDLSIAGIPMKLENRVTVMHPGNKKNTEEGVKIPVNSRASALIFLHTAFLDEKDMAAFNGRITKDEKFLIHTRKSPVAFYLIRYDDNTTEKVMMHFGYNTGILRPAIHSRYPYDVRHVYREKQSSREWPEAKDGRDITPGAPALYQYEWINPHPGKTITDIAFVTMGTEVIPAWSALTLRRAK